MTKLTERLFYRIAKRWIAGYTIEDAVNAARDANNRKVTAILNRLGEHTPDRKLIQEYSEEYLKLLDVIQSEKIQGTISVKPSQIGLALEAPLFKSLLSKILEIAEAKNLSHDHKSEFEFQMLKGIRDDLKSGLIADGFKVSEYIPYGPEWYNYSKRRMRERKRNILLLLRSITG